MKTSKIVSERPLNLSLCGLCTNSTKNASIVLIFNYKTIKDSLFAIGGYSDVCY
jgi:hypothetical protein